MKTTTVTLSAMVLLAAAVLSWSSLSSALESRVCFTCREPITGSYFETGGHFYHPGCFTCEYCKKPIEGPFTVFRKKNYHTQCFEDHVALKCAVCGGTIEGQYLLDYWGNAYHVRHKDSVVQCDFCQRFIVGPLGDGMKRFPDGRTLCSKCAPSSITSVREARSILVDAADNLRSFGVIVDPKPVELRLVSQQEFSRIARTRSGDTKGFTDYAVKKNGFGKVQSEVIKVYLLNGMPRTQMASTAAHELMHIWQFRNGRLDQSADVSEGSCNFASYLVLRKLGGAESEFVIDGMLKDPDYVYGRGFRRVKSYVEAEGTAAWLRVLKVKNPDLSRR
jgi:hypothetical protein